VATGLRSTRDGACARSHGQLLAYAIPLLKTGTVALFPKGQDVGVELTLRLNLGVSRPNSFPARPTRTGESFSCGAPKGVKFCRYYVIPINGCRKMVAP